MNILLLGATGFLGKNIYNYLQKKEHRVCAVGRTNVFPLELANGDRYVSAELKNINFMELVAGYECVIHLVSSSVPAVNTPLLDIDSTLIPTIRLLDACVRHQVGKVIFFSSGGTIYGNINKELISETDETNPISAYGIHKLTMEKYMQYYNWNYGLNTVIMRVSNPYGRFQKPFTNQGLIANALASCLEEKIFHVWGDGRAIRDYIYIDDVMSAVERVLSYTGQEKIFNIGSGKGTSILAVIDTIERITGKKLKVNYIKSKTQFVSANVLNACKAQRELGWQPSTTLDEGIANMACIWNSRKLSFED